MIKKMGEKYALFSKKGNKKLGEGSEEEMKKRERQVNYFKSLKKKGYLK